MLQSDASASNYNPINTFSRQPSPAQIVSYLLVLFESLTFYLIVAPSISSQTSKVVLLVFYSVLLVMLVISTFMSSYIDPSDSIMMLQKQGKFQEVRERMDEFLYCDLCRSYVGKGARHCRQCDRCVENFDHHCMWINNCIGSKNYRMFMIMIFSALGNMLVFVWGAACLTAEHLWGSFLGLMVVTWIVLALICALAFLLVNLAILHIYLGCKGYTTYQFIMMRREEEKLQELRRAESEVIRRRRQSHLSEINDIEVLDEYQLNKSHRRTSRKKKSIIQTDRRRNSHISSSQEQANILLQISQQVNEEAITKIKLASKISDNSDEPVIFGMKQEEASEKLAQSQKNERGDQLSSKINNSQIEISECEQSSGINFGFQREEMNGNSLEQKRSEKKENRKEKKENDKKTSKQRKTDQFFHSKKKINKDDEGGPLSDSVQISQFFTRNKSFSLIISNEEALSPHSFGEKACSLNTIQEENKSKNYCVQRQRSEQKMRENEKKQIIEIKKFNSSKEEQMKREVAQGDVAPSVQLKTVEK